MLFRSIEFTVDPGTVTVVIGPSGSGKTTLLRTLDALDLADGGIVRIGDITADFSTRVDKTLLKTFRAQSAMVFQTYNLFPHRTVLENIIEGPVVVQKRPRDEACAEAHELLKQVGLEDKADEYPFALSGGQQQRVGIARALALRPKLSL